MNLKNLTLLAAATAFATTLLAQDSLLILSKQAHTLSIVDPVTLKIIAKAPVGPDPHEVTVSTDGHTAYVSNYGGGAYNTLDVIDLSTQKTTSVDVNPLGGPHGLAFSGGKVWFTSENAKAIARLDPATQKVDLVLGTGQNHTHMITVTPDQKRAISINANSVSIYTQEKATGPGPALTAWVHTLIPVGDGSEGFDITPNGKQLWTSDSGAGTISVIDLASKKLIDTIPADVTSANRLKFTPDGRYALVSLLNAPDLVIVDTATHKVTQRIPIGKGAAGIQMEPNGNRAFIACTPDNYVVVLDLHTLKVLSHLDAGSQPDGMAWAIRH